MALANGNSRGVLLTLLTIVLFILMLGIIITYVTISLGSEQVASGSASSASTSQIIASADASAHAFLKESLAEALGSLASYEGTPQLRRDRFVNDTASALSGLMLNGTVFGTRMPDMNATMANYTQRMEFLAAQSYRNLSIDNASITVYDGTPFSVNVTYTALDVIRTGAGTEYYPVTATAGVSLNGTPSLASVARGSPTPMVFSDYPEPVVIGASVPLPSGLTGSSACSTTQASNDGPVSISISPNAVTIPAGGSVTFTNSTTGNAEKPYTYCYSVEPTTGVTESGNKFTFYTSGDYNVTISFIDSNKDTNATSSALVKVTGQSIPINSSNGKALFGSQSPFMFAYGALVVFRTPKKLECSDIPSKFQNGHFILAAYNISESVTESGLCGMGGLVLLQSNNVGPGLPPPPPPQPGLPQSNNVGPGEPPTTKPYLVYNSSDSAIFNYLNNGTEVLLDGPALELLNVSAVRQAVQSGLYFASPFSPSYLDRGAGLLGSRSPDGLFSLSSLGIDVLALNGAGYMSTRDAPAQGATNALSAFAWVKPTANASAIVQRGGSFGMAIGENGAGFGDFSGYVWNASLLGGPSGVCKAAPFNLQPGSWYLVGFTFNGSRVNDYVNGIKYCSVAYSGNIPASSNAITLGGPDSTDGFVNGSIADVQIYNWTLLPVQVQRLYTEGIDGVPASGPGMLAWWPLDGNDNDYSGNGLSSLVVNASYVAPGGYYGDASIRNVIGAYDTNPVEGVMGCDSVDQCSNNSLQRLYLGNGQLADVNNVLVNSSSALGMGGATVPDVVDFNGEGGALTGSGGYIEQGSGFNFMTTHNMNQGFTISIWVYPETGNGVIVAESPQLPLNLLLDSSLIELVNGHVEMASTAGCKDFGTIPVDRWSNIVMTGTASLPPQGLHYNAYINGNSSGPGSSKLGGSLLNTSMFYPLGAAVSSPLSCNKVSQGGSWFDGKMADYQFYDAEMSAAQVQTLYTNNTIPNMSKYLVARWPLAFGLGTGMMNVTPDIVGGNDAQLYSGTVVNSFFNTGVCTNANVISGSCRVSYSSP